MSLTDDVTNVFTVFSRSKQMIIPTATTTFMMRVFWDEGAGSRKPE